MGDSHAKSFASFGFLTVLAHPELGLFGGFLLTDDAGRPLEFHCTTPVKPNRAQEILYGPTLRPYFYGELIGRSLVDRAEPSPSLIFTDSSPTMAVRDHVASPVAVVVRSGEAARKPTGNDMAPHEANDQQASAQLRVYPLNPRDDDRSQSDADSPRMTDLQIGPWRISVRADRPTDRAAFEALSDTELRVDLCEPFDRIREAICEAQRISMSPDAPLAQAG